MHESQLHRLEGLADAVLEGDIVPDKTIEDFRKSHHAGFSVPEAEDRVLEIFNEFCLRWDASTGGGCRYGDPVVDLDWWEVVRVPTKLKELCR